MAGGFPGHDYACIRLVRPGPVGRGQPFLPENSHVISLVSFRYALKTLELQRSDFKV